MTDEMRRMDIMLECFYSRIAAVPGLLFLCDVLGALILIKVFLQVQELTHSEWMMVTSTGRHIIQAAAAANAKEDHVDSTKWLRIFTQQNCGRDVISRRVIPSPHYH